VAETHVRSAAALKHTCGVKTTVTRQQHPMPGLLLGWCMDLCNLLEHVHLHQHAFLANSLLHHMACWMFPRVTPENEWQTYAYRWHKLLVGCTAGIPTGETRCMPSWTHSVAAHITIVDCLSASWCAALHASPLCRTWSSPRVLGSPNLYLTGRMHCTCQHTAGARSRPAYSMGMSKR
jgi:hypothetical protein